MTGLQHLGKIIKRYGLRPASQRELPLFTSSCVARAYTKLLKGTLGFSYEAVGVMGSNNKAHYMFNEAHIAQETRRFIEKNSKYLDEKIFSPSNKIFNNIRQQLERMEELIQSKPNYCLKIITKIYPRYFLGLTMYNCFWRSLKTEEAIDKLPPELINRIASERESIANLYPKIERIIQLSVDLVGKKNNFKGDLLRYLTLNEMKSFLAKQTITKGKLKELILRRKKHFYLFIEAKNKEYIFVDKNIIKNLYNNFFSLDRKKADSLKGYVAYPGLVKGVVYNLSNHRAAKTKNKFVLVASMTKPDDGALIKKSLAVVTDEGGILSHAAITAREFKKPCIIGTKIATKVLKDGDVVEVDANKGVVKIQKSSKI